MLAAVSECCASRSSLKGSLGLGPPIRRNQVAGKQRPSNWWVGASRSPMRSRTGRSFRMTVDKLTSCSFLSSDSRVVLDCGDGTGDGSQSSHRVSTNLSSSVSTSTGRLSGAVLVKEVWSCEKGCMSASQARIYEVASLVNVYRYSADRGGYVLSSAVDEGKKKKHQTLSSVGWAWSGI